MILEFDTVIRYVIVPLTTIICAVVWFMIKKQDTRIDVLEKRTNDTEKNVLEIKTEFKYIARDIQDIKNMLTKISEK